MNDKLPPTFLSAGYEIMSKRMYSWVLSIGMIGLCGGLLFGPPFANAVSQETLAKAASPGGTAGANASDAAVQVDPKLIEGFEKYLTNAVLTGVFTIDGRPLNTLEEERYEIKSAKKIEGEESLWEISTRIKYGDKDLVVPVPIHVEWVGRTPMMVLDSITIPGLGTFSARVVFHDRKYAGTWKHDNVGGHLFGRVEPGNAAQDGK